MTKGKHHRRRGGAGPASRSEEAILRDVEARLNEIAGSDPGSAGPIWGAVHKLLLKTRAESGEVAGIIATRDAKALGRLVRALRGVETPPDTAPETQATAGEVPTVPPETLKKALRAFRKRINLVRLDHESRLGVGPMTSGKKADFDAIMPPREFGPEVWEALVAAGRLRAAGKSFYMLPETDEGR